MSTEFQDAHLSEVKPLVEKEEVIILNIFKAFTKLASILSSTLRICRKSPSTLQFATWMHLVSRMGHHLSKLGTYILPWISCLGECRVLDLFSSFIFSMWHTKRHLCCPKASNTLPDVFLELQLWLFFNSSIIVG
uniref:Uncharacterized protein n=1 Tax=Pavo cristatus TaxID=9049 RepID=A0A8C9GC02_PAVCR